MTTVYKPPLQILFWNCSEGKGCSKISKIPKNLCKTLFFSNTTGLQSRISSFNKTDSKANVSCQCSEIAGNTLRKDRSQSHFIKVTRLLLRILRLIKIISCIVQGIFRTTPGLKISEDSQKNVFGKVFLSSSSCLIYHFYHL